MNQDVPEIIKVPRSSKISCFSKLVTRKSAGIFRGRFVALIQWTLPVACIVFSTRFERPSFLDESRSQSKDFGHFFGKHLTKNTFLGHIVDIC